MHQLPLNLVRWGAPAAIRRRFGPLPNSLRRWGPSTSGSIAVEFAILAGLLIALALGAYDFGRIGIEKSRLTSAAQAGVRYGVQDHGTSGDLDAIVQAARDDAGDTDASLNITARQTCRCPGEGEVSCSANCSDGAYAPMYVEVTAQRELAFLFSYPGIPPSLALTSTSAMRVK